MINFFSPDFYIGRDFELNEIKTGLAKNGIVAITGEAGVGKTVLSKFYAKQNIYEFSRVFFHNAAQFNYSFPEHIGTYLPVKTDTPTLTIIDGIDEIGAEHKAKRIVNQFLEAVRFGHKLILTYRNYFFHSHNPFDAYEIKVGSLSETEASILVEGLLGKNLGAKYSNDVKKILSVVQNNPLGIVAALDLLQSNILSTKEIVEKLYGKLFYNDSIFEQELSSKIIIPESPGIITDIKIINTSLAEKVKADPNFIFSMSPRQFEEFVAELFEKDGYNVSLTKQTRDGGKDIFIVENKRFGKFLYYLECKRFSPEIPVGVRFVRELYGTVVADRATAGLLVTSSYFSKEAIKFTEQVKTQMSLMEFIDLKKWISNI